MPKLEGTQKAHIRMSKLKRASQAAITKVNSREMAKILFWGDPDPGRHEEVSRLLSETKKKVTAEQKNASYGSDQLQYLLTVMLVLTMAEKRAEDLYQQKFAQKCDQIRDQHGLKHNQYWNDGEIPAEWQ